MNSDNSSGMLFKVIPRWFIYSLITIAYIGFLDAMYLTAEHYSGAGLTCVIFKGCDQVASSSYSEMFGLPVALYGVLYYLGILFVSLLYLDLSRDHVRPLDAKIIRITKLLSPKFWPFYTLIGFVMSVRFVYLQLFVIKAICTYCMFSALTSTLLFVLGAMLFVRRKSYI